MPASLVAGVEEYEFKAMDIFCVDIVVSTGEGKAKESARDSQKLDPTAAPSSNRSATVATVPIFPRDTSFLATECTFNFHRG